MRITKILTTFLILACVFLWGCTFPITPTTTASTVATSPTTTVQTTTTPTPKPTSVQPVLPPQPPKIDILLLESQVHNLINAERVKNNLKPVAWNSSLSVIAQNHSKDMALRNYFNGTTPEGLTVSQQYNQAGFTNWTSAVEIIFKCSQINSSGNAAFCRRNVPADKIGKYYTNGVLTYTKYYSQDEIASLAVNNWMESTSSSNSILKSDITNEGIGIDISQDYEVYITLDSSG